MCTRHRTDNREAACVEYSFLMLIRVLLFLKQVFSVEFILRFLIQLLFQLMLVFFFLSFQLFLECMLFLSMSFLL